MELNIIFVSKFLFPNGTASTKRLRYIIDYLNDNKIENHVIILRNNDSHEKLNSVESKYNETCIFDFSNTISINPISIITYYFKIFKTIKKCRNKEKNNFLLLNSFLVVEVLPLFIFSKLLGFKIIFDKVEDICSLKHNITFKSKFFSIFTVLLDKIAVHFSEGFILISSKLMERYAQYSRSLPMLELPNSTKINSPTNKTNFSTPISILYSGTFAFKDNVSILVDVIIKLKLEKYNIKLILTGYGQSKEFKEIMLRIQGKDFIEYLGFLNEENLNTVLHNADIITVKRNNSDRAQYGFPFKLSEGLATGNTIIATNVGDISKYTTHKKNIYLIEPDNFDSLYYGIKYLIDNQNEAINIGNEGLNVVMEHFNLEKNGKKFVDFLKHL